MKDTNKNGSGRDACNRDANNTNSGVSANTPSTPASTRSSSSETENRGAGASSPSKPANANTPSTNHWSTRKLVTLALLCAIGVLLSFIEIPLLPAAPWLKYDASAVSAMVAAFAFGPGAGIAVGVLGAIIHGILLADFYGAVMNIIVVCAYVAPAALIYAKKRNYKRAFIGLGISIIVMCAVAILGNLVVTPFYAGIPLDAVIALIIPVLIPFNLIKGFINSALTLLIYKSISNLITPAKKQVRGR